MLGPPVAAIASDRGAAAMRAEIIKARMEFLQSVRVSSGSIRPRRTCMLDRPARQALSARHSRSWLWTLFLSLLMTVLVTFPAQMEDAKVGQAVVGYDSDRPS